MACCCDPYEECASLTVLAVCITQVVNLLSERFFSVVRMLHVALGACHCNVAFMHISCMQVSHVVPCQSRCIQRLLPRLQPMLPGLQLPSSNKDLQARACCQNSVQTEYNAVSVAHVKLLKIPSGPEMIQKNSSFWVRGITPRLFCSWYLVVSYAVKTTCLNVGAAPASPFWVTTGQAGGANQPILNASPAPRFNSQVQYSYCLLWIIACCLVQGSLVCPAIIRHDLMSYMVVLPYHCLLLLCKACSLSS